MIRSRSEQNARLFAQLKAQETFLRKLEQLSFEISMEQARRHLDHLLDHLDDLAPRLGDSVLAADYRARLVRAKAIVSKRHKLSLVRSTKELPQ